MKINLMNGVKPKVFFFPPNIHDRIAICSERDYLKALLLFSDAFIIEHDFGSIKQFTVNTNFEPDDFFNNFFDRIDQKRLNDLRFNLTNRISDKDFDKFQEETNKCGFKLPQLPQNERLSYLNGRIKACSEVFSTFGFHSTPIFVGKNHPYAQRVGGLNTTNYVAALNNISIVDEDKLTYEKVVAFKDDHCAHGKYLKMHLWLESIVSAQSEQHATELVASALNDYEAALKKHGISIREGKLSMYKDLISLKNTMPTTVALVGTGYFIGNEIGAALLAGLSITMQATASIEGFLIHKEKSNIELESSNYNSLAIIYEAKKSFE